MMMMMFLLLLLFESRILRFAESWRGWKFSGTVVRRWCEDGKRLWLGWCWFDGERGRSRIWELGFQELDPCRVWFHSLWGMETLGSGNWSGGGGWFGVLGNEEDVDNDDDYLFSEISHVCFLILQ